MIKRIVPIILLPLFLGMAIEAQVISLGSLLREMTDPCQMAQFPVKQYQSLQASSYNRASISADKSGWFADSDGVAWIREEQKDGKTEYVVMEHSGPGCITRLWTPFFYYDFNNRQGPDIKIYLDGHPEPVINENFIGLLTGKGSVKPPFASLTARAGVCFLPIPFARSCKITMTGKAFYHIVNYRAYEKGTRVRTFTQKQFAKEITLIEQTAKTLLNPKSASINWATAKKNKLNPNESIDIDLPTGAKAIRELTIRLDPKSGTRALRSTILEMTFDGVRTVWCPVGDFFCSPDKVNPFQTWNRKVLSDGTLSCRYVMPYEKTAQIRLINLQDQVIEIQIDVKGSKWKWDRNSMHFSASWNQVGTLSGDRFADLNFIDIKGKGVLVGDALTVLSPGHGWWGEGDEKIYIDEPDVARRFPSHFGTGTEDYYGWAGGVVPTGRDTFSIPVGANVCNGNAADPRGYNICTRNRILDVIPFNSRLVFDMEASPGTDIREPWNLLDYSLVAFWYAIPGTTSNAVPQPETAAKSLLTLQDIDKMQEFLKSGAVKIGASATLPAIRYRASPGQFFVFHLTVPAETHDLNDVRISFSNLDPVTDNRHPIPDNRHPIPSTRFSCFNSGGIDFKGKSFTKRIDIPSGNSQELWMGIDLEGVGRGDYEGSLTISSGSTSQIIPIEISVEGDIVKNHGYDQGKSLARLNWLNSKVGIDDSITKGFIPVNVIGKRISILGRSLELGDNGLPVALTTFFTHSNQELKEWGEPLMNSAFRFVIEMADGTIIRLKPGQLTIEEHAPSKVTWKVLNTSEEFDLEVSGQMEFDGFIDYKMKLTARSAVKIKDIRMEIPMNKEKSQYMMGLNHEGGYRTPDWKWKWDITKNQDMLWIGAVNGGLRIKWKAENWRRPLINIYYEFGRLNLPPSWGNEGKGGVNLSEKEDDVVINAFSGPREIKSGEVLNYDFELLLTPFRTIDKKTEYEDRYFHGGGTNTSVKIANAKAAGANIINIHHAEDLYPFINYPYLDENRPELKKLVAEAHQANLRMKFYYTTRELTKNLPEFEAFYSLNGEVIFPGPGDNCKTLICPNGPNEWLKKNLKGKYIPAWFNLVNDGKFKGETDLSVITTPDSRLNNFYVAGLDWMVQNIGIDGVYIDDSALDRFTLMRARKIIDRYRPEGRMDLHSWNHFNQWAGFTNCLNLYMDLLPYFDLVWIGEGRDYNRMPDHWLIEVSGIPFGLPGQMLEGGGNPWRGMVYGISNRAGWTANPPGAIWNFWDNYQIQSKEMFGYWDKNCPVSCTNSLVKATLYQGKDLSILSVANWSAKDQTVNLIIDWIKLGLDPKKTQIFIPAIKDFQTAQKAVGLNRLTIPGGKGYLIVID
ncbi:MAG: glycoside hydrolase domain-containing protein [Bacteroidales bacterium]|jgi:hypothetical protein